MKGRTLEMTSKMNLADRFPREREGEKKKKKRTPSVSHMSAADGLTVGEKHELKIVVREEHTAAKFGSGLAPVLSTPFAIGCFESACKELVERHLKAGQSTVGSSVMMKHTAATPVGMAATFSVEVVAVDGRRVKFRGVGTDEVEQFAEVEHERFIIDYDRFMQRVATKAAKIAKK